MNLMNPKFSSILKTPHKHPQISNTTQIQKKKKKIIFFILLLPIHQIKVFHQSFQTRSLSNGKTLLSYTNTSLLFHVSHNIFPILFFS